jgi:putative ABC transport system permease protein
MALVRMTSLAWLNLLHDRWRLVVSVAGVSFAVVLMAMELGFQFALLDSVVEVIRLFNADLVVISATKTTLAYRASFNRRILDETLRFDAVKEACPLYMESRFSLLRNPEPVRDGRGNVGALARKIRVIAFNPDDRVLNIPELLEGAARLKEPDTGFFDTRSVTAYGHFEDGQESILARRPVRVVGTFQLGTDLANDGNFVMSDQNFLRYFPDPRLIEPELRLVDVGLLRLKLGADADEICSVLQSALESQNVKVFTKEAYLKRERAFWNARTPIGVIFRVGVALGLVVGMVICYQILSSDIADHLSEYATLKAMGYSNAFLIGVVVVESLVLSATGFVPGIALSVVLYQGLASWTGLLMQLNPLRTLVILGLTVAMCLASSVFSIRKILSADPAGLF